MYLAKPEPDFDMYVLVYPSAHTARGLAAAAIEEAKPAFEGYYDHVQMAVVDNRTKRPLVAHQRTAISKAEPYGWGAEFAVGYLATPSDGEQIRRNRP